MADQTRTLVIGATGGIGAALVQACRARGDDVVELSRAKDGLDLTDEDAVARVMGALGGAFSRVFIASGALEIEGAAPEKTIKAVTSKSMLDQFAVNAVGPALILRHLPDLLDKQTPAKIAVLSARVGSIGDNRLGGWVSYRAAKAAVNQIVRTAAIEMARTHPQAVLVALHPGTVETAFTQKYLGRHPSVPPAEAAANLLRVLEGMSPAQTGGFYDWAGKVVPW